MLTHCIVASLARLHGNLTNEHDCIVLCCVLQDEMVPFAHMQQLHKAVRTPQCMWVEFARAYHMDAYVREHELYWSSLNKFMSRYVQPLEAAGS